MSNRSGQARSLIVLSPLRSGVTAAGESFAYRTRRLLQGLPEGTGSPFASVPDTYMARWYLLDDVRYQGGAREDHLHNRYLALLVQHYGPTDRWLDNLWRYARPTLQALYTHAWGFDQVRSAEGWRHYIERCRVPTGYFFNGSNDEPLMTQLKALYLRQQFTVFVMQHQGLPDAELQAAFVAWAAEHQPDNLTAPTWQPGADTLHEATAVQADHAPTAQPAGERTDDRD